MFMSTGMEIASATFTNNFHATTSTGYQLSNRLMKSDLEKGKFICQDNKLFFLFQKKNNLLHDQING